MEGGEKNWDNVFKMSFKYRRSGMGVLFLRTFKGVEIIEKNPEDRKCISICWKVEE